MLRQSGLSHRRRAGRAGSDQRARASLSAGGRRGHLRPHRASAPAAPCAAPQAERIDVGSAAPERLDQEAICYLIAEKAREDKLIARLKWGDPFVFDQGGVEALFLHEQGIPFEVVPGVPAAIGVAGLRGHSGHLSRRRRHGDVRPRPRRRGPRQRARVDWTALAKLEGTIVCYAGPRQLPSMLDALLVARPARRRIGGHHHQRHAADAADAAPARCRSSPTGCASSRPSGPAMLVVGNVVGLREHLRWFDARPLFGRRVLVTRSREQAGELVELLEAQGAEAVEAPLINIVPPDDYGAARRGVRARRRVRLDRLHERQRRRRVHGSPAARAARRARAGRRQAVRGRSRARRRG